MESPYCAASPGLMKQIPFFSVGHILPVHSDHCPIDITLKVNAAVAPEGAQYQYVMDSRAISPWALGPRTLGPRTLSPKYFKSQGPEGRGPKIPRTSGPRPLGPWDLGYMGPKVRGPKAQGLDASPGFSYI